jgi:multisubunit Na+/H+ antiporter MnhE subunit
VIALVLRVAGLVAIYLLVLTSLAPGDILVGALLAIAIVGASRPGLAGRGGRAWTRWATAVARMLLVTAWEMSVGTVRVIRYSLRDGGDAGFIEIPRDDRSRRGIALWGVLTGEAPDEYPVAVDDSRHVLIVHNFDASDPAAVRARHASARDAYQRDVMA